MTAPDPARCRVDLPVGQLRTMIRVVRALHRLHGSEAYGRLLQPHLPEVAHFRPGHEAVMMGYDFHVTPLGPRLIEVNTNAGGALMAFRAHHPGAYQDSASFFNSSSHDGLLATFNTEMALFSAGRRNRPERVLIVDDRPEAQFLFPEMEILVKLFSMRGIVAATADPGEVEIRDDGVYHQGFRVDMIYNRHCDFYLESEGLLGIRSAYLLGQVCLSPNPWVYGVLADKRRMILWSDSGVLESLGLSDGDRELLLAATPLSRLLTQLDREGVWRERNRWVFKPVASHGGKGVLLGRSISRSRFLALEAETTLAQHWVAPSMVDCGDRDEMVKSDFRLFVYGKRVLGVAARVYRGQITTFREPGSGYAPVRLV